MDQTETNSDTSCPGSAVHRRILMASVSVFIILALVIAAYDGTTGTWIPRVIHPDWKATVPKFNVAIINQANGKDVHVCSGVLVSRDHVVTIATKCVMVGPHIWAPDDVRAQMVTASLDQKGLEVYKYGVEAITAHPDCCKPHGYDSSSDIALLKLEKMVDVDDHLRPAQLSKMIGLHHPGINQYWDLSNYAASRATITFSDAMWFVRTRFVSGDVCKTAAPPGIYHDLKMTCAWYYHPMERDCSADIGSGLSYKEDLIGLLLHKQGCGGPNSVAVFVNVGVHSEWIRNSIIEDYTVEYD